MVPSRSTGWHLLVPALMGTIMSIGVATSNSVLIIMFANEHFTESKDAFKAALEAGATRLRPVMLATRISWKSTLVDWSRHGKRR
ncbi:efflux RND transporter permease subunit [Edaphobacter modestus]|uniref:efflux RND transporter permease subunit n=1 Tax=Edaphobacter modestus TaxID=388466 RepID=UPI00102AFAF5|nr:efflux RND transporter permease subunit [Edaphobacter modestus]